MATGDVATGCTTLVIFYYLNAIVLLLLLLLLFAFCVSTSMLLFLHKGENVAVKSISSSAVNMISPSVNVEYRPCAAVLQLSVKLL